MNIPEHINAPRQFPMPLILPLGGRYANPAPEFIGALAADQRDPLLPGAAPVNNDDPFIAGAQIRPIVGWRDMVANLPPMPAQPARRGRGRPRHISEPRNILSGPQANVNLNNVHRGQIAHREQAENHRQIILNAQVQERLRVQAVEAEQAREAQAVLLQQLQEQREREIQAANQRLRVQAMEAEQAREGQAAFLQQLQEQRERELQARIEEEQREQQLDQAQLLHEALEHWNEALDLEYQNHAADDLHLPAGNAQARNLIHNQWRAEHEEEHDPDLNDNDIDDLGPDYWQRLDDDIAQVLALDEPQDQQAADIYGENRRFENQVRRDIQNQQNEAPDDPPPRNPRDLPRGRRPYVDPQPDEIHSLGPMNVLCSHCNALHWDFEKLTSSTVRNAKFGSCCLQGQIASIERTSKIS